MKCMLDLDGVLVDFIADAHRYYGLSYSYEDYPYELGNYHNCPPPNSEMTTREFWDGLAEEFWENIPWMHDGHEILTMVERAFGRENICLLTSPIPNYSNIVGKLKWVARELPEYAQRYLVGPAKSFCASPNTVLVDDADFNIEAFAKAGGRTVLVSRPWNSRHATDTMPLFRIQLHIVSAEHRRSQQ